MNMLKVASFMALLSVAISTPALAQGTDSNAALTEKDQSVLRKLSQGSIDEVQLGKLAQKMATNNDVQDFGKRMVQDHSQLGQQVQQLASKSGIALPAVPSSDAQSEMRSLSGKSGQDFDRGYIQSMLGDHQKDIAELQQYSMSTQNPDMKKLVGKALPIFENHIRVAENVAGKIGVSADKGLNQPVHPIG